MKRTILLAIIFSVYTWFVSGQNNTQWVTYLEGYSIDNVADADDYLWFSTSKEVYRFEKQTGNTTHFDFGNLELPENYSITTIKCDENGLPWVGALFAGTLKMTEEGKWILLPPVSNNEFEKGSGEILFTENGTVWTSNFKFLTRYQGDAIDTFTTNGTITSLAEDNGGNLWIGTADYFHGHYDCMVKYDGENWTVFNSSQTGSIPLVFNNITVDKNGTLWMGGYEGIDYPYTHLVEFDGTNWNVYSQPYYIPFHIRDIAIDDAGTKWLATNHGLIAFDGTNWMINNVLNTGIPSDDVYSIIIDSDGTKWIGTENGLAAFNENEIGLLEEPEKSDEEQVIALADYDSKEMNGFELFPNPSNDFIILKMPALLQNSSVDILSIQGRVIKSIKIDKNQNRIDVSHLPGGVYLIRIQSHEKYFIGKFVKQ